MSERCWIFHKWGKWIQYSSPSPARQLTKEWGVAAATEHRQCKRCYRCGIVEDKLIRMQVNQSNYVVEK